MASGFFNGETLIIAHTVEVEMFLAIFFNITDSISMYHLTAEL